MANNRKPAWLKVKYTVNDSFREMRAIVQTYRLHTVCQEARCPNQGECWRHRTATLMLLGRICTRNCGFCAVRHASPVVPEKKEPERIAQAVQLMGLSHCVITSVTRDDLPDGGAMHWAETIRRIRQKVPHCKIEVLIPDFQGDPHSLEQVLATRPDVLGHNLETVAALYPKVRPQADYQRALLLLERAKKLGAVTKTGLMLGLGETTSQVIALMRDARQVDCDLLTLGQYLQSRRTNLPVERYIPPEEFDDYRKNGLEMGFKAVQSGPLVRSSYHAREMYASTKTL